jgi:tetratricopeptide (TPR) repeat protein
VSSSPSRSGFSPSAASNCLIRSCIVLFYVVCCGAWTPADRQDAGAAAPSADALYEDRANLGSAEQAAALWRAELARDPQAFDAAWKLSRVDYYLGDHLAADSQREAYEDGIDAGRKAAAIKPGRAEGHFWLAANMGMMAESFGLRAGLKYRGPIRDELLKVVQIDGAYNGGSAYRALGRWYDKVPRLFGGNKKLSEQYLKKSLEYAPNNTVSHFFLAELYVDEDRTAEARAELQKVLDAPPDPDHGPEDREYQEKARLLLVRIKASA